MASYLGIEVHNVDETVREMRKLFDALPQTMRKATASAMNGTLKSVRQEAVKISRTTYTAKSYSLKKRTRIERATAQKTYARLDIKDRNGIGLINFSSRPASVISWKGIAPKNRRKTVTNKVRRDGKRRVYNDKGSPFVAQVGNGRHIFVRDSHNRLQRLYGPSLVYALFGREKSLENHAEKKFTHLLQEELEKIL